MSNIADSHRADTSTRDVHRAWLESLCVAAIAALAVYLFRTGAPNGDGRVYMRQIEAGLLVWNPNHLLMQPVGVAAFAISERLGLGVPLLTVLRLLSGTSAVVSLVIFHRLLVSLRIAQVPRLLTTAALLCSAHFLSMAIAEEFNIIQIPPLMVAFWAGLRWVRGETGSRGETTLLAVMGAMVGLATVISFNNGFLLAALGFIGLARPGAAWWDTRRTLLIWLAGALVVVPSVLVPYATSGSGQGLLTWLTSYGGSEGNVARSLYFVEWSPRGILTSLVALPYQAVTGLFLLGPIGPVASSLLARRPLEFVPEPLRLGSTILLLGVMAAFALALGFWMLRAGRTHPHVRFAVVWAAGYVVFNFLWTDGTDQFWFQLLPAFWVVVTTFLASPSTSASGSLRRRAPAWALAVMVPLLASVNIYGVVAPRKQAGLETHRSALTSILKEGDLFITPGWDDIVWLGPVARPAHERVLLMDLALQERSGRTPAMHELPALVHGNLTNGRRVLVARLFDKDGEGRPWEQIAKLSWPRARIQSLLAERFEHVVVGTIDGVVFRELRPKPASGVASTSP